MSSLLPQPGKVYSALAPMQDVTDRSFMNVIDHYGAPDYFFTEYFRVHVTSCLDKDILESITHNQTDRPIFAQMIGEDITALVRIAKELEKHPIAGVDLNMGCPAPRIYRKNVGGGLLRDPEKIDQILGELRSVLSYPLTVKMRVGFEDTENFDTILQLLNHHQIDLLSLHGRTVKEMYHGAVNYDLIAHAVKTVNCPVFANGNITSAQSALEVLKHTQAAGVMIGRSAIRNPWIFSQIRQALAGEEISIVPLSAVRAYIDRLYHTPKSKSIPEKSKVSYLKMYLNYIGQGVDAKGKFLQEMRRAQGEVELFEVCDRALLTEPDRPFALEPYSGLTARPKAETPRV
jgi:tRNA-dihydrouridine synthase B